MRKISSDELPGWFDLDHYEGASDLSLLDWRVNLDIRHGFWGAAESKLFGGHYERFREKLFAFLKSGEAKILHCGPDDEEFRPAWRPDPMRHQHVESTTLASYFHFANDIRGDQSEISSQIRVATDAIARCKNMDEYIEVWDGIDDILDTPIDRSRFGNHFDCLQVDVDMSAPDKLIIAAFKSWLKEARRKFDISGKSEFTPATLNSWADNRVLPYIDLCLWASTIDAQFTDEALGQILFPDDYDKEAAGRIRKTVRPKAEFVMNLSVIAGLQAQIENMAQKS